MRWLLGVIVSGFSVVLHLTVFAHSDGIVRYLAPTLPLLLFIATIASLNATLQYALGVSTWYAIFSVEHPFGLAFALVLAGVCTNLMYQKFFARMTAPGAIAATLAGVGTYALIMLPTELVGFLREVYRPTWGAYALGYGALIIECIVVLIVISWLHYHLVIRFRELFLRHMNV